MAAYAKYKPAPKMTLHCYTCEGDDCNKPTDRWANCKDAIECYASTMKDENGTVTKIRGCYDNLHEARVMCENFPGRQDIYVQCCNHRPYCNSLAFPPLPIYEPLIQTNHHAASISISVNQTSIAAEEDDSTEESTTSIDTEAEQLDRYRRLIPYMTYYLVNNYVRAPQQQQQQAQNTRYQKPTNQDDRFIPSLQYDPKGVGPDSDVFVPVRFGDKNNYEDYNSVRTPRPVLVAQSTIPETRYHTTSRPDYTKLVPAKTQPDYPNYGQEFESIRFVPQLPKNRPSAVRYAIQPPPTPAARINLNHVLKGLQLTNQLPEVLNKDNIDSSINTLVEILNILNMGKKEDFPPVPNFGKFKVPLTKSKVITESNYEATQFSPSPHNELVEIKTARPHIKPLKIPISVSHEQLLGHFNPYSSQIKTQLPVSNEELINQHKTTRPYFHQIKSFTTPLPPLSSQELIGQIKSTRPYFHAVKAFTTAAPPPVSNEDLVGQIKTTGSYLHPIKTYTTPSPVPSEELINQIKSTRPYLHPIKAYTTPSPVHNEELINQIKTTGSYLHPIKSLTTPIPNEDVVEIKPIPPYFKQIKASSQAPSQDVTRVKPYFKQVTVSSEDLQTYIDQTKNVPHINHYTKAPVRYEDLIEVKQRPTSIYLDPSKITEEDLLKLKPYEEQSKEPVDDLQEDVKTYEQTTETRTPLPPTQEPQKNVEFYVPIIQDIDVEKETYKPANTEPAVSPSIEHTSPNNYIHHDSILEDERLTLPVTVDDSLQITEPTIPPALKYGATRGKPHVDYPAYTEIPETDFSCKLQRYKGFFGDPQTGCQVWHYCDLNGGKSSFLCPNGTIFNQVALTCDWWFNVKCESTPQLYVLNERLYKYILPVMPKFPEDFTGPDVDKYLELKFKEMEAKMMMDMKKKKESQQDETDKSPINTLQSIEDSKKR